MKSKMNADRDAAAEAARGSWISPRARVMWTGLIVLAVVLVATAGSPRAAGTFDPKVTFEVSTTQATAHPDARITIDNSSSSEKLKTVTLNLPKGFWGSLAAVDTKCPYATAAAGSCSASTKIGTVKASAKVDDSDVVLSGSVYLTTPGDVAGHDYTAIDPAWISVKIVPTVGGVTSFDPIITPGRVILKNRALPVPKSGAITGPESMQTILGGVDGYSDIPTSVTDSHSRTINFSLQKVTVDLKSDLSASAPLQPLLTNPSACGANPMSASFTGWDGGDAAGVTDATGAFTVTGCDKVKFRPSSVDMSLSDPTVNTATGIHGDIQFPADSASIASAKIVMPPNVSFNSGASGPGSPFDPSLMCPASAGSSSSGADLANPYFIPSQCTAPESQIGKATIYSPLVPTPLKAKVMFVARGSTPSIAIYADSTTDGGTGTNPKGVSIAAIGLSSAKEPAPDCPVNDGCPQALQTEMKVIPDAPVSRIVFDIDYSADTPRTLAQSKILKVGTPSDPSCAPYTDFSTEFTSNSSTNPPSNTPVTASHVVPQALSGCDAHTVSVDGLTTDSSVNLASSATPSFAFTPNNVYCSFGSMLIIYLAVDTCSTPVSPSSENSASSTVPVGVNSFIVSPDMNELVYRRYTRQTPLTLPETDTTPPTSLSFTDQPSDPTSDVTPTASYSATGASAFQCSLDGGSFLPCGTGTSGSYTVPDSQALIPGDATHTIAVRASDDAGNVSAPVTASFKVDVPFDPTFDVSLSTRAARQHPTMDVTITSGSHEDMKNLSLSLPDGFLGGLSGVPTLCPVATASAGGCTAASEVGTVETEAIVDESTVRLPGKVYMTDPIQLGDPAGLYIDVPAKLQDVDQGHITVPVRLTIRGQVQGINSTATDLPTGITPNNGIDGPTEFDLRSIVLKLRNNPSASQPLLTNPSQCGASAFAATFGGADATTVSKSVPFAAENCGALAFGPQLGINITDLAGNAPKSPLDTKSNVMRLMAHLAANPNDAGIRAIDLLFPKPVTINVSKLPAPCQPEQYAAGGAEACPPSSNIGNVSATSPLLRGPLVGHVFILKQPGQVLPKLLVALRGAISTDIIGRNEFVNNTQIHTVFDSTPDVPLSTFDIDISNLITSRDEVCQTDKQQWNVTGTMFGYNGSAASVLTPLSFDCAAVGSAKFKNRRKKSTATIYVKAPGGSKLRSVSIRLPKGLKLIKSGLKKRVTVRASSTTGDYKKLKRKCFKFKRSNRIDVSFCKKKMYRLKISFRSRSLSASRKLKKPKFKVTAVDALKRKTRYTLQAK